MKNIKNIFRCKNKCPQCGAGINDIAWGRVNDTEPPNRSDNICKKCGCVFEEVFAYSYSMITTKGIKKGTNKKEKTPDVKKSDNQTEGWCKVIRGEKLDE